ncbi:MAG: hypothetical protein JWP78_1562 [Mucilaginibacter sp.]|nr:hypothetical protein [Mucilaginibacter sp.]
MNPCLFYWIKTAYLKGFPSAIGLLCRKKITGFSTSYTRKFIGILCLSVWKGTYLADRQELTNSDLFRNLS